MSIGDERLTMLFFLYTAYAGLQLAKLAVAWRGQIVDL